MKYVFGFELTNPIDCKHDTTNKPDVEFQFAKPKKQTIIEGFKITVYAEDEEKAYLIARKRADKLTDILSATSGTFSEWIIREMPPSGDTLTLVWSLGYAIHNNTVLDFPDDVFMKILDGDHLLNKRLGYLRDARRAERTGDWESVIKYLHCEAQGKNELLRCLRNLLTHQDNLYNETITEIKKHYPSTSDNGLRLNGNKFDPADPLNTKSIKFHAGQFLNDAHTTLRSDLKNSS